MKNTNSTSKTIVSGVAQDSVLSPFFLLLLTHNSNLMKTILFVDDPFFVPSVSNVEKLQNLVAREMVEVIDMANCKQVCTKYV